MRVGSGRLASKHARTYTIGGLVRVGRSLTGVRGTLTYMSPGPSDCSARGLARRTLIVGSMVLSIISACTRSGGGTMDGGESTTGFGGSETGTAACTARSEDMVCVPEGSFMMGCSLSLEEGCSALEFPYHEVWLDAFDLDEHEVTVGEYAACIDAGGCTAPGECNGDPLGDSATLDPWGDAEPSCEVAVMSDGAIGCGRGTTWPVGSKPDGASPHGALDMAGNVEEWVGDWFNSAYYADSPPENPQGPESGTHRVVRGGAFTQLAVQLRVSARWGRPPETRAETLGFRCAASR